MNTPEPNFGRPTGESLEARLSAQPLRSVPPEWKAGIIRAARNSTEGVLTHGGTGQKGSRNGHPVPEPTWWERLVARFPVATVGLATIWILVGLSGVTDRWLNGTVASLAPPMSAEQVAEARAQRAALWQLAGFDERLPDAVPPRAAEPTRSPALRPRSDLRSRESIWKAGKQEGELNHGDAEAQRGRAGVRKLLQSYAS